MQFKFKRKYWWIHKIWNKGEYDRHSKNYKIIQNYKKRNLKISKIIRIFNMNPELFKSIKYFNIIRKPRNVFINISTLRGKILKNSSCGMYYKRGSERRTYVAFNELLEQGSPNNFRKFKDSHYIIRVRANNYFRAGFKRNIRMFLKKKKTKIYKHIGIKFKAHNGVRKKKKKRK